MFSRQVSECVLAVGLHGDCLPGDVQLTPTVPASKPFAKRMARSMFLVYTDAYSPYLFRIGQRLFQLDHAKESETNSVALALASTSSSDSKTLMLTIGPKISPLIIFASSGVFLKIVGSMK